MLCSYNIFNESTFFNSCSINDMRCTSCIIGLEVGIKFALLQSFTQVFHRIENYILLLVSTGKGNYCLSMFLSLSEEIVYIKYLDI